MVKPVRTVPLTILEHATLMLLHSLELVPPFSAKAQRRIGLLQARSGQLAHAIRSFEGALAKGLATSADFHHQMGRVLLALGRPGPAAEQFRRAVALDPKAYWSFQQLGQALVALDLAAEAEVAFRSGLAVCPGNRWLVHHLTQLLFVTQRYADCLDLLIEAGLQPGVDPPRGLPLVPFRFRRLATRKRIEGLQEVVARFPRHAEFALLLSLLLADTGDQHAAAAQLDRFRMLEWRENVRTRDLVPDPTEPAPSFLIVGQGKAGTTAMYEYICQHPKVLPAISKEVRFWSEHFGAGLDWYRANFLPIPASSGLITGEASPDYIHADSAPERVAGLHSC